MLEKELLDALILEFERIEDSYYLATNRGHLCFYNPLKFYVNGLQVEGFAHDAIKGTKITGVSSTENQNIVIQCSNRYSIVLDRDCKSYVGPESFSYVSLDGTVIIVD